MHKFGTLSTLTLAVVVVAGSLAMAAGPQDQKSSKSSEKTTGYSSQQQEQSSSQKSKMQSSGTPVLGGRTSTVIFAAVDQLNQEQNTIMLRSADGTLMEMEIPEDTLSDLQQGDIVEVTVNKLTTVSIDKVQDAQTSASSDKTQGAQQRSQQSSQSSADRMSAQGSQAGISSAATVKAVDSQEGKLTLQMEKSGKTVEMQAPEQLLSNLQRGDSVEVSIRKSQRPHSGDAQSSPSKSQSQ